MIRPLIRQLTLTLHKYLYIYLSGSVQDRCFYEADAGLREALIPGERGCSILDAGYSGMHRE